MLEKRGYINSPLSPAMLLNFLGAGSSILTINSGDYSIDFATAQSGNHPIRFVAMTASGGATVGSQL